MWKRLLTMTGKIGVTEAPAEWSNGLRVTMDLTVSDNRKARVYANGFYSRKRLWDNEYHREECLVPPPSSSSPITSLIIIERMCMHDAMYSPNIVTYFGVQRNT